MTIENSCVFSLYTQTHDARSMEGDLNERSQWIIIYYVFLALLWHMLIACMFVCPYKQYGMEVHTVKKILKFIFYDKKITYVAQPSSHS